MPNVDGIAPFQVRYGPELYILPRGNPASPRPVGVVTDPAWSVAGVGNFDF